MTCSICGDTILARGWCSAHYNRWRRWGDPEAGGSTRAQSVRLLEDIEWLAQAGENLTTAAQRVGTNPVALERRLYRAKRGDLVSRMKGVAR